jgi:hypothetical protein
MLIFPVFRRSSDSSTGSLSGESEDETYATLQGALTAILNMPSPLLEEAMGTPNGAMEGIGNSASAQLRRKAKGLGGPTGLASRPMMSRSRSQVALDEECYDSFSMGAIMIDEVK